jgi:CRP-like cAMP-binding protein
MLSAADARWSLLGWYSAFIGINAAHAVWLICERKLCRLTNEERRLCQLSFPALDQATLKRLLRQGAWRDLAPGTPLTRHGEAPRELYVLLDGAVDVRVGDRNVAAIKPGHFVGEMGFVTGQVASADTVARTQSRVFCWNQQTLRQRCRRDAGIRDAIYAALGPDLARKIVRTSATLAQRADGSGAAQPPATEPTADSRPTDGPDRDNADRTRTSYDRIKAIVSAV